MNRAETVTPVFGRMAVACDHGGLPLKSTVVCALENLGIEVFDLGTDTESSVDYPDYAARAAREVASGAVDAAVLICGTGIGMAIAANKIAGIRAATCGDEYSTRMTRAHNDANVLTLGARVVGPGLAEDLVRRFCATPFEGGRHARRLRGIGALEGREGGA